MTPGTKETILETMRNRRTELRDRLTAHEQQDAQRALAEWKKAQEREANEAKAELVKLDKAMEEIEKL